MIKIALNTRKPDNVAFYCPKCNLHLTRSNPLGYVQTITGSILTGLKYQTLIDVDNVVDIKTGEIKTPVAAIATSESATEETTQEEATEKTTSRRRSNKKAETAEQSE